MNMARLSSISAVVAGVALLAACTDQRPAPTGVGLSASRNGLPFTEGLASPVWQTTAANLVAGGTFNPIQAAHAFGLVGVAQYLAVQRAEGAASDAESGDGGRSRLELDRGAVAGASAVVLTYLFPSQAQSLEDMVQAQANDGPGGPHPAFARGEAAGRAGGAAIVARAQNDGISRPFTGPIPTGTGLWISNTNPPTIAGGQLPSGTPWV